ncbi:MAG: hypothetical protein HY906_17910 [Deltaproteobacteria bacterium]|nr:hypothetical protein [Deltaproteobacteria bacterium]
MRTGLVVVLLAWAGLAVAAAESPSTPAAATQPAAASQPSGATAAPPASSPAPPPAAPPPARRKLTFEPHVLVDLQAAPFPDDAPDVGQHPHATGDDRAGVARVRRAWLGASGRLPGPFAYRLSFATWDGAEVDDGRLRTARMRLLDTWVALAPGPWLAVGAGELPVGFMRARLAETADEPLFERPRFVDRLTPDRRLGGAAWGDLGMIGYRLGVYRAVPTWAGEGASWPWDGPLVAGRLEIQPIGPLRVTRPCDPWFDRARVAIGAAALYGPGRDLQRLAFAADLSFAWRHLLLRGEALFVRVTAAGAERRSFGFFVEGTYRVWRFVEVEARHEWSDGNTRDDPFGSDLPREWATTVGAALLLAEDRVRLGVAYVHREGSLPSGPSGAADAALFGVRGRY